MPANLDPNQAVPQGTVLTLSFTPGYGAQIPFIGLGINASDIIAEIENADSDIQVSNVNVNGSSITGQVKQVDITLTYNGTDNPAISDIAATITSATTSYLGLLGSPTFIGASQGTSPATIATTTSDSPLFGLSWTTLIILGLLGFGTYYAFEHPEFVESLFKARKEKHA